MRRLAQQGRDNVPAVDARCSSFARLPFRQRVAALPIASVVAVLLGGCIVHGSAAGAGAGVAAASASPANSAPRKVGPSGLPVPPGGGAPRPSGAPENLTVLDWAGFKGAVSYTFDDTNSSQIQHYAELQALGVPMTFYLITGKPEFGDPVWAQAVKDGHEIGSHSRSHAHTGTDADLDAADQAIRQKLGVAVWTMASPFGDASYPPLAAARYLANRGVADGLIAPNDDTDPFNLHCYVPPAGAPAHVLDAQIDAARTAGRWKTVLVHGFVGGSDAAYKPVAIAEFVASVNHAKALGDVWIDSVAAIGAYWRAQKMFSTLAPATTGATRTWTWTLPAHFPPGRYVRVKVDGGTLAQAGRTLTWDEHGYYEVALDAGTLTLSP